MEMCRDEIPLKIVDTFSLSNSATPAAGDTLKERLEPNRTEARTPTSTGSTLHGSEVDMSLCRICARNNDHLIPIFEGEGLTNEIGSKISQYFPFKVSENDGLPNNICTQCATILMSWHNLVMHSIEANNSFMNDIHTTFEEDCSKKVPNECNKISVEKMDITEDKVEIANEADIKTVAKVGNHPPTCPVKRGRKPSNVKVDLQEYKLHYPLRYHTLGEMCYLRTKVLGFEPTFEADVYVCCLCNESVCSTAVIEHSKSHYPLQLNDYCQSCQFGFGSVNLLRAHMKRHVVFVDEEYSKPIAPAVEEEEEEQQQQHIEPSVPAVEDDYIKPSAPAGTGASTVEEYIMPSDSAVEEECITMSDPAIKEEYVTQSDPAVEEENIMTSDTAVKGDDITTSDPSSDQNLEPLVEPLQLVTCELEENYDNRMTISDNANEITAKETGPKKEMEEETKENINAKDTQICEHCGLLYRNRKIYLQHVRRTHELRYSCEKCKKRFGMKYMLERHKCIVDALEGDRIDLLICKCKKTFDLEEQYKKHTKTCMKVNCVPCNQCSKRFPNEAKLHVHVSCKHVDRNAHPDKKDPKALWMCEVCGCKMGFNSARKHYLTHVFTEKKDICLICSKKFRDKNSLSKHLQTHSNDRPFSCEHCTATFKRSDHKKTHLKQKHNIGDSTAEFECRVCKRHFTSEPYLLRHQRLHAKGISYECQLCKSRFATEHSLKMHQTRTRHDRDDVECKAISTMSTADWTNKFRCSVCFQRYGSKNSLLKHSLVHMKTKAAKLEENSEKSEEAPVQTEENDTVRENIYECPKCKLRYLSELGLKIHLARAKHFPVDSKDKSRSEKCNNKNPRFKCLECKEMFGTLISLKMHTIKRKHFSKCPQCGKKFALQFKLKNHLIKVHQRKDITDEESDLTQAEKTPYECSICLQKFAMKHNLVAHTARKHERPAENDEAGPAVVFIKSESSDKEILQESTPIIYHCTECWDNFLNEEDFNNHTHQSYIITGALPANVVVTEIIEAEQLIEETNVIIPAEVIVNNGEREMLDNVSACNS